MDCSSASFLGSFQRLGQPSAQLGQVTAPHPWLCADSLCELALPFPCAVPTSACSQPSCPFPSPSCFVFSSSSALNHCVFGFHTSKAVTSSVNLKNGLFCGSQGHHCCLCCLGVGHIKVNMPRVWRSDLEPKKEKWQHLWEFMAPSPWVLLGQTKVPTAMEELFHPSIAQTPGSAQKLIRRVVDIEAGPQRDSHNARDPNLQLCPSFCHPRALSARPFQEKLM